MSVIDASPIALRQCGSTRRLPSFQSEYPQTSKVGIAKMQNTEVSSRIIEGVSIHPIRHFASKCPVNALTVHVGTGTNLSSLPTYRDLTVHLERALETR